MAGVAWLGGVRIVLITDRRVMGADFGAAVVRAVRACPIGTALVQVREKDLDGGPLLQLVHAAMACGAPVMVNDRLDVALAAGADGVHLPENGLTIAEARRVAPEGFLIGRSVHAVAPRPASPPAAPHPQIDKAIGEHLRIVERDPKDVRVWLRIGDLFAKKGATQDAITAYLEVGRFYDETGFQLKAVAVYKQVLKLDPKNDSAHRRLAALYRTLGLLDDAELFERAIAATPATDLVQLGPIFETPGKGPPLGVAALTHAREALPEHVRLVAVGGISTAAQAAACRMAGADAVAVIRAAWHGGVAELA